MSAFVLRLRDIRLPLRLGETLVGRSPYCSIVLMDPLISREHAAFRVTHQGLTVQDLGSRNGTVVNGHAIPGLRSLRAGDSVELGGERFEIELGAQQAAELAPCATLSPKAVVSARVPLQS
jgi:pSer/pThr/pTyr-binding forkhead associated (FHA) protein